MTKSAPLIWHLQSKCLTNGEDSIIFCGLLSKHELYQIQYNLQHRQYIGKDWYKSYLGTRFLKISKDNTFSLLTDIM